MRSEHQSLFQVPYHPDVLFEVRHAAIEDLISTQHTEMRRIGAEATKVQLIAEQYGNSVKNLFGSTKYEQLRSFVREQKQVQATQLFPPQGPAMSTEELGRIRQERRVESQRFLDKLGVDVKQFQNLSQKYVAHLQEFGPQRPVRHGRPVMVMLPSYVPPEILAYKTNPWTVISPPFDGWSWWHDGFNAGFSFTPTLHLDATIGFVGNRNHIQDTDASDNDYGYMKYSTAISFWYQMPASGLVEVWIEAQSNWSHHHVSLWDEFGWSDSAFNQHNYLTLKASVGESASELQLAEMSWFQGTGHTDGYWDNHYLVDGDIYWANLVSDPHIIIPAGAWVLVEVGMLNWNTAFANDVSVYSTLDFAWTIKHVSIHSTGG